MYKLTCSKQDRGKYGLIPGGRFHPKSIFQFPSYYPSMAVYKWMKPDSELDLESLESDLMLCREPAVVESVMRPHQKAAFNFIQCKRSCLIGDAPGVGKTLPVIESMPKGGCSLVVAPASLLVSAWADQIGRFRPDLVVNVVRGTKSVRKKLLEQAADVYVISYDNARTHSQIAGYGSLKLSESDKNPGPLNREWDLVVLDEAHRIKNAKAKTSRMAWKLAETAEKRVALTGTPVSNNPIDIWSILKFLDPDIWTSRSKFIDLFLETYVERFGSKEITKIGGVFQPMQPLFDKIINFYMLRRTLDEVADPPRIVRQKRYAQLTTLQKAQYKTLKKDSMIYNHDQSDYIIEADPLPKSTRLHQIAQAAIQLDPNPEAEQGYDVSMTGDSGKLSTLKETLQDIPDTEQIVLFTMSRQLLIQTHTLLKETHNIAMIHGQIPGKDREQIITQFENNETQILLATLGALSEGVTLNAASTAIFLQRSFSLVQSTQAEARIRRLNSTAKTVKIIDIVTEKTIDELPLKAIEDKTGMFNDIIESPRKRLEYALK